MDIGTLTLKELFGSETDFEKTLETLTNTYTPNGDQNVEMHIIAEIIGNEEIDIETLANRVNIEKVTCLVTVIRMFERASVVHASNEVILIPKKKRNSALNVVALICIISGVIITYFGGTMYITSRVIVVFLATLGMILSLLRLLEIRGAVK